MGAEELDLIVNRDLLFDFYGELLTDHQKKIFEEVYFNDCSVSEVARDEGISRQGVSDLLKRTQEQLAGYEQKLGLVRRFREQRGAVKEIFQLTGRFGKDGDPDHVRRIRELAEQLLKES